MLLDAEAVQAITLTIRLSALVTVILLVVGTPIDRSALL